ncbi:AAA-type ATPase lid domain-containing protein [Stieleria varia]|uniref:Transcriptional regulatory protein ZraR n=1 Tax=Stieleria varia TaxID=2528005 RepID=A0A5C6AP41_9BACT|nr:helix-turn-helix domain-containing protein [Stieleria varia]TWU01191.1 Transcriptional regulatory protein ZraR [Stieleria varia]
MASATKIRPLARALDACDFPFWVIGSTGKLIYVSATASTWLQVDGEQLIGRRCVAGAAISDDPLDFLAASLSAPPGFLDRGTARLNVQPPLVAAKPIKRERSSQIASTIPPMEVRFVRLGSADKALTLAIAGQFEDHRGDRQPFDAAPMSSEMRDVVLRRETLDHWRRHHATRCSIVTAGNSPAARRIRARLRVAAAVRTHVGFFGPAGSGRESIARQVHQWSAPGEPLSVIEGPLMDAELLDASMAPLLTHLTGSQSSSGTALVRDLDQMPIEAQHRLTQLLDAFPDRLRVLGLCGEQPVELSDEVVDVNDWETQNESGETPIGLTGTLIDALSTLSVRLPALAERVEDISILATAMLDRHHAAGESIAERIGRAALDALVIYPWPQNIDELEHAIRHAARSSTTQAIAVENLPLVIRSFRSGKPQNDPDDSFPLDELVQKYESSLIDDMLRLCDGNRAEAARRLGISRARLLRKLDQEPDA